MKKKKKGHKREHGEEISCTRTTTILLGGVCLCYASIFIETGSIRAGTRFYMCLEVLENHAVRFGELRMVDNVAR